MSLTRALDKIKTWVRRKYFAIKLYLLTWKLRVQDYFERRRLRSKAYEILKDQIGNTQKLTHKATSAEELRAEKRLDKELKRLAKSYPKIISSKQTTFSSETENSYGVYDRFSPKKSDNVVNLTDFAQEDLIHVSTDDAFPLATDFQGKGLEEYVAVADTVRRHATKVTPSTNTVKRATGRTSNATVDTTTDEHIQLHNQISDAIIPPPRKSDVAKSDLAGIAGSWEANPNADEYIQLAARMPIVNNQIRTIIEHLITSRPAIQGPAKWAEPIRRWFEVELEINSNHTRSLEQFIEDVAKQMLYYGSSTLIKQRSRSSKLEPFTDPLRGRTTAPLWGYMVPDMATMEVFVDKNGRHRFWRQRPDLTVTQTSKKYRTSDVHVLRLPTRNNSLYFWTPSFVMPALYSINVLRELHETIERHTQSIVDIRRYGRVGSKDYQDGRVTSNMLNRTAETVNNTPRGATPIFPHYVKIEELDLKEYIEELTTAAEFWELEVRRGVGGSSLSDGVGDSSTRNTSDALVEKEMRTAQSLVPVIQRAFRWLIMDILWENDATPADFNSREDIPALVFEEIDMTQQIRRETHHLQLFQGDGINHGEFRQRLGEDPDPERADKYFSDINTEQDMKAKAEEVKSQTQPGGSPRPKRKND